MFNCHVCGGRTKVTSLTHDAASKCIRRYRKCQECGAKMSTTQAGEKLDNSGYYWKKTTEHARQVSINLSLRARGENNSSAILTEKDVKKIRADYENGLTTRAIANKTGMTVDHIRKIVRRDLWKHVA